MRKYWWVLLLFWCSFCLGTTASLADIYNPQPADGDLVLPMPDGASMVFRRVFIGEGDKPFALREFKVGDRSGGGFKEFPTNVALGGSFVEKNPHGEADWVYYLGKYEVTEAQYYALMKPGTASGSQQPITNISWLEAQEFINTYNLWLFENAKGQLPQHEDTVGYVRLPTEIEWEFAARGGNAVEPVVFDKKHPYAKPLNKHEWFSGPSSSHDKLKDIGLRQPNPLGLHDMLGNVTEMTASFYQVEYYQGRFGGFVARGGNYLTSERKIRSSLRNEIPFYRNLQPGRQPTLGLRLVISSPIYASHGTSDKLAAAWDEYVETTRKAPVRPVIALTSLTSRTDVQLNEALESLAQLVEELNALPDVPPTVLDQLGLLNASFKNIESTVKSAQHESASAWIKIAVETAMLIHNDLQTLPHLRSALQKAKKLGKSRIIEQANARIREVNTNIDDAVNRYSLAFEQLAESENKTIDVEFDNYQKLLKRKGSGDVQIQMSRLVKRHIDQYLDTRRSDVEQWKADFRSF